MKPERNSVIECLRIFSVIGIIGLHIYGEIRGSISFANKLVEMFWGHVFAMAVPFFILISGWHSVSLKHTKLVKIHLLTLFYSIMLFGAEYYMVGGQSWKDAIRAIFPIVSQRYWYFSCYFVLLLFSGLLNWISDNLPQELYLVGILVWMIVICSPVCIPSFGFVSDYLWEMLFYYMVGRYLRKYGLKLFYNDSAYLFTGLVLLILSYVFDVVVSIVIGRGVAWTSSSIFTLKEVSAIFVFYFFAQKEIHLRVVNRISLVVPAVYAGEHFFRIVFDVNSKLIKYANDLRLVAFVILWSIAIFVLAGAIECLRRVIFGTLENRYEELIGKVIFRPIFNRTTEIMDLMMHRSEKE